MTLRYHPVALAALWLCLSPVGMAQTLSSSTSPSGTTETLIEPVVVTATRIEQPVSETLADIDVLDATSLLGVQGAQLGERLQLLPSVEGLTSGNMVFIRGAEARMTAVYLDGIRIDRQDGYVTGGGAPWSLIAPSQAERIEILRGPSSSQYGSDGMGGVIQILSVDGRDGARHAASLGLGSQQNRVFQWLKADQVGAVDYAIALGRQTNAGYDTKPDIEHTPATEYWTRSNMSATLGLQINPAHHVALKTIQSTSLDHEVRWDGGPDMKMLGNLRAYSLVLESDWSDQWRSKMQWSDSKSHQRQPTVDGLGYDKDHFTRLSSLRLDNHLAVSQNQLLSLGLEHIDDTFEAAADDWFNAAQEGSRQQDSVNASWSIKHGVHSFQTSVRNDHISGFGNRQTWGLSYGNDIATNTRLVLGASTGFRAPTLSQMYDSVYGDPNLKPETSEGLEAKVTYQTRAHALSATWYRTHFTDLISAYPFGHPQQFVWYNVDRARVQGVSLEGSTVAGAWRLGLNLDYTDAINSATRKLLNYRSPRKLAAFASRSVLGGSARLEALAKSKRWDDAANTRALPGYAWVNLEWQRPIDASATFKLRVDNLFDRDVEEVSGLASPGRRWLATMHWDW